MLLQWASRSRTPRWRTPCHLEQELRPCEVVLNQALQGLWFGTNLVRLRSVRAAKQRFSQFRQPRQPRAACGSAGDGELGAERSGELRFAVSEIVHVLHTHMCPYAYTYETEFICTGICACIRVCGFVFVSVYVYVYVYSELFRCICSCAYICFCLCTFLSKGMCRCSDACVV